MKNTYWRVGIVAVVMQQRNAVLDGDASNQAIVRAAGSDTLQMPAGMSINQSCRPHFHCGATSFLHR